ncbi:hypothetical protein TBLA_0J01490 [Henningerozyma blattae CBS 6284]|uniref:BZIP domain-containing protein n=1 Tax=Henningerozyma blattae (strain ATCC 34711 / CBS 6284 / DSM 70876 / NBRC 10599 / NRRL Y-10934 / UCD 77-7) TaxID=1071380 RepID=I2H9U3_HENB6|nr:hypothetical protein TBLA_0J01490 [Tetrapisispora blattae CBS 6284]CCH63145.1 hypothetical protein TBLA_0J01490 [Tetrapisispora blattae CBS 6284]
MSYPPVPSNPANPIDTNPIGANPIGSINSVNPVGSVSADLESVFALEFAEFSSSLALSSFELDPRFFSYGGESHHYQTRAAHVTPQSQVDKLNQGQNGSHNHVSPLGYVPRDVSPASSVDDEPQQQSNVAAQKLREKRQKNLEASARFRIKRKKKLQDNFRKLDDLKRLIARLNDQINVLNDENIYWKQQLSAIHEKKSRDLLENIRNGV